MSTESTRSGSSGDSDDNVLAETVNGLFKAELIRRHAPRRTIESVELATRSLVDWWNHRQLHGACNDLPLAGFEAGYYAQQPAVPVA